MSKTRQQSSFGTVQLFYIKYGNTSFGPLALNKSPRLPVYWDNIDNAFLMHSMMHYYTCISCCRIKPLLSGNIINITIVKQCYRKQYTVYSVYFCKYFMFFLVNFNILTNNITNYLYIILDQIFSFKVNGCLSKYDKY